MKGYDFELVKQIAASVKIPVIACGGLGCVDDLEKIFNYSKADAAAAGAVLMIKSNDLSANTVITTGTICPGLS